MGFRKHIPWQREIPLLALALLMLGCGAIPATTTTGSTTSTNTTTSASPTVVPAKTPAAWTGGWDSFMLSSQTQGGPNQNIVLNVNISGKSEALTQYVVPQVQYDGIAPNGKDLLYQHSLNDHTQFYTVLSPRPGTGFFYEEHNDSPNMLGNAIWMSDSRHVLVLNPFSGVWQVDVQSGQFQKVLSIPIYGSGASNIKWTVDGIQQLLAYRNGTLYFQGSGSGECMGAICSLQINTNQPTLIHYSPRQTGTTSDFLLSPDGQTIYYCNTGPAGSPGLYAVNSDGTHGRTVRQSDSLCGPYSPVGFAQDNGLVAVGHINGKFEVVELGDTPQQDRVLLADAAPGATSLCVSNMEEQFSKDVCPAEVALAPYSHAIVVQGTLPNGQFQLWTTDLTTGKQQVIHPIDNGGKPVQLLGWDQLPVCGSGRC